MKDLHGKNLALRSDAESSTIWCRGRDESCARGPVDVVVKCVVEGGIKDFGARVIEPGIAWIQKVVPAVLVRGGWIRISPQLRLKGGVVKVNPVVQHCHDNIASSADGPRSLRADILTSDLPEESTCVVEVPLSYEDHWRRSAAIF
jgi:hypothetical protein